MPIVHEYWNEYMKRDISIGTSFASDVLRSAAAFVYGCCENEIMIVGDNDNLDNRIMRYILKLRNFCKEYIKKSF